MGEKAWYAATNDGLFISVDHGKKWYGQSIEGEQNFNAVNGYEGGTVTLTGPKGAYASRDDGKTWTAIVLPKGVTHVYSMTMAPDSSLWLGTRQGALHSTDGGQNWRYLVGVGLPNDDVLAVRYDADGHRLLATALHSRGVFESKDGGKSWQSTPDAGVPIRAAVNYQGHLLAASFYNGLLLQQSNVVESASESAHSGERSQSTSQR